MGLPCFKRWKIATKWIICFSFYFPPWTTSSTIEFKVWFAWTLSFVYCWLSLLMQWSRTKNCGWEVKVFLFLTCFCKPSNLGFISFLLPSTREQILQHTMWILLVRFTIGSTQGNWATHSSLKTFFIAIYFFLLFVCSPKVVVSWVVEVDANALGLWEVPIEFVASKLLHLIEPGTPKANALVVLIDPCSPWHYL